MSRTTRTPARTLPRRAALASLLVLPLAACGAASDGDEAASDASDGSVDPTASGSISIDDPWVKAADGGMTAAFGTITNGTGSDLVLTAVTSPATDSVQLHETASDGSGGMSMQEKEDGFDLPAGEHLVLEPGGDHIMLMDLPEPLEPGDELELTLVFSEGTEYPFTATVKDFTGAEEDYAPGEDDAASDGGGDHASHGDHDDPGEDDDHADHDDHGDEDEHGEEE